MTDLERRLVVALETLSAQYEMERRQHAEQVEALQQQVEALRLRVERRAAENEALQRRIERLDGQVTSWIEYFGTLAARSRGRWI